MHPEFPETYLPQRIARAAEQAMTAVLEEDFLLRTYGVTKHEHRSTPTARRQAPR